MVKVTDSDVLKLIDEYVGIIRGDHHKSRDLIFMIEKRFGGFDGGLGIRYRVDHPGYCNEWAGDFSTYQEAIDFMAENLRRVISSERSLRASDDSWG